MAGRKRIYPDDKLVSKCLRLSLKYEWKYVLAFSLIIRKFRKQSIEFIEKYITQKELKEIELKIKKKQKKDIND